MAEIKASRKMKTKKKKQMAQSAKPADNMYKDLEGKVDKAFANINKEMAGKQTDVVDPMEQMPPKGEIIYRKQDMPAEENIIDARAQTRDTVKEGLEQRRIQSELAMQAELSKSMGIDKNEMPKAKRKMKVRKRK